MNPMNEMLQKFSDELFESTGCRLNLDNSAKNLALAFPCEDQRTSSPLPEIPVLSVLEFTDREIRDGKLAAFDSDLFFLLKEEEEQFDANFYPSSFVVEDTAVVKKMLKEAYENLTSTSKYTDLVTEWFYEHSKNGDKIRLRQPLPPHIKGSVAILVHGEPQIIDTNEYVMIFCNEDAAQLVIENAYPI